MPDTFTGDTKIKLSNGEKQTLKQDRNISFNDNDTIRKETVSKSSTKLMSTSVRDESVEENSVISQKKQKKAAFLSVKSLMNRFVGSSAGSKVRQVDKDGLVKGGLTPTISRRDPAEDPVVSTNQEFSIARNEGRIAYAQYERGIDTDSTSRPLMTQANLQVLLPNWDKTPGTVGIYNHGNTCFMNTILQCLSNTDSFADYFVNKRFKDVIHQKGLAKKIVGSPRGEVTECLGSLLESLWAGSYTPDVSNHFKNIVSKYNAQYTGSSQHDAQEFLLWLLDRINEDLHYAQKKKAAKDSKSKKEKVETVSESSPGAVSAQTTGCEVYNRFQALYRSSLTCPNCSKDSNTYESYLCLSLPVPQKMVRPVYITVVYLDDNPKQLKIALEMNVMDSVRDLRDKLAFELDVTPKRLILCQLFEDGFGNTFGDDQPITDIHESETIYAFETFPQSSLSDSYEDIQILIVHVEKIAQNRWERFCYPQVIHIPRDVPFIILQRDILRSMGMAVSDEIVNQASKLDVLFKIRIMDSGGGNCYLPTEVEWPLYTQAVDRALATYGKDFGPQHIKFVVEWDNRIRKRIVDNDEDIIDEHQSVHKARLSQQQPSQVPLDDCLKLFTKEETLGGEDGWQCPHCGRSQKGAMKKLGLWSVPDILVIHLKRFRQSGLRRNKLNVLVNFPVSSLDLSRHILERKLQDSGGSAVYDLFGVSNHYGNMNGGHYTAFCKNPVDCRWYEYDDTHVKHINSREIVSKAAYLLFYQRKQLGNDVMDALHSGKHWIFQLYGLPSKPHSKENVNIVSTDGVDGSTIKRNIHSRRGSPPLHEPTFTKSVPYDDTRVEDFFQHISTESAESTTGHYQVTSPTPERRGQSSNWQTSGERNPPVSSRSDYSSDNTPVNVHSNVMRNTRSSQYRRADSVDSSRNSGSYYSSSDGAGRESSGSSPPSPVADGQTNNFQGVAARNNSHMLNNERQVSSHGGKASGEKLLLQANEIHRVSDRSKLTQQQNQASSVKVQNKNNNIVLGSSNVQRRFDVWSTPQQGRKSPSPPTPGERGPWLTPQPQRRRVVDDSQINTRSRPSMERQFSTPTRARPKSAFIEKSVSGIRNLQVEGTQITNKPPLPKSSVQPSVPPRPSGLNSKSAPSQNGTPTLPERRPIQSSERVRSTQTSNKAENYQTYDRTGESNPSRPHDQHFNSSNHSTYDRSNLEPHSLDLEQFGLTNGSNFSRREMSSQYATMSRMVRRSPQRNQYSDSLHSYGPEPALKDYSLFHQPRFRAPITQTYNPAQYQDLPRYQPQLYQYATNMAMREQKELNERMKASYLKESSV